MVVLGVIVFIAGLVALYSAITNTPVATLARQVMSPKGGNNGG